MSCSLIHSPLPEWFTDLYDVYWKTSGTADRGTGSHLCVSIYEVRPCDGFIYWQLEECWWRTESYAVICVIGPPAAAHGFFFSYLSVFSALPLTHRPMPGEQWTSCGRRDRGTAILSEPPSTSTLESGSAGVRCGGGRQWMGERVKNELSQWWWCESGAAWGRCIAERPSCRWRDGIKGWNPNICLSSNLIHPVLMCPTCAVPPQTVELELE